MGDRIPEQMPNNAENASGRVPRTAESALREDYLQTSSKRDPFKPVSMSSRVPADREPSGRNRWNIDFPNSADNAAKDKYSNGRIQSANYDSLPIEQITVKNDGQHFHIKMRGQAEITEMNGDKLRFAPEFAGRVNTEKGPNGQINKITIEPEGQGIKAFGKDRNSIIGLKAEAKIKQVVLDNSKGDGKMRVTATVIHPVTGSDSKQPERLEPSNKFDDLAGWIQSARALNPRRNNVIADIENKSNPNKKMD